MKLAYTCSSSMTFENSWLGSNWNVKERLEADAVNWGLFPPSACSFLVSAIKPAGGESCIQNQRHRTVLLVLAGVSRCKDSGKMGHCFYPLASGGRESPARSGARNTLDAEAGWKSAICPCGLSIWYPHWKQQQEVKLTICRFPFCVSFNVECCSLGSFQFLSVSYIPVISRGASHLP